MVFQKFILDNDDDSSKTSAVFSSTFYWALPCFCERGKCGFGCVKVYLYFNHILHSLLRVGDIYIIFFIQNNNLSLVKSLFDFIADLLLAEVHIPFSKSTWNTTYLQILKWSDISLLELIGISGSQNVF